MRVAPKIEPESFQFNAR